MGRCLYECILWCWQSLVDEQAPVDQHVPSGPCQPHRLLPRNVQETAVAARKGTGVRRVASKALLLPLWCVTEWLGGASAPLIDRSQLVTCALHCEWLAGCLPSAFPPALAVQLKRKYLKRLERATLLVRLVDLDVVSYEVADIAPQTEYELYIGNFGSSNSAQATTQYPDTNEIDTMEVQTEKIHYKNKDIQVHDRACLKESVKWADGSDASE